MKYHAIPTPQRLTKGVGLSVRHAVNQFIRETIGILAKITKKDGTNCSTLFYLHDKASMSVLMHSLVDGDEIVVHAEGCPFIIGPVESGPYTLTPFKLAALLDENRLPDLNININLLSCNSATEYNCNNFACDVSQALHVFFRYKNISVTGYTGFIEVKSNAKFAVSSVLGRSTKGTHSDLDSAKIIYKNGSASFRNKILINTLSMVEFSWAQDYIKQANRERRLIDVIQKINVINQEPLVRRSLSYDLLVPYTPTEAKKSNHYHFFQAIQCQDHLSMFSDTGRTLTSR